MLLALKMRRSEGGAQHRWVQGAARGLRHRRKTKVPGVGLDFRIGHPVGAEKTGSGRGHLEAGGEAPERSGIRILFRVGLHGKPRPGGIWVNEGDNGAPMMPAGTWKRRP